MADHVAACGSADARLPAASPTIFVRSRLELVTVPSEYPRGSRGGAATRPRTIHVWSPRVARFGRARVERLFRAATAASSRNPPFGTPAPRRPPSPSPAASSRAAGAYSTAAGATRPAPRACDEARRCSWFVPRPGPAPGRSDIRAHRPISVGRELLFVVSLASHSFSPLLSPSQDTHKQSSVPRPDLFSLDCALAAPLCSRPRVQNPCSY